MFDPRQRREWRAARVSIALIRIAAAVKKLTLADSTDAGLTPVQAQTLLFARYTKSFMASVGHLAASLGTSHATAVGVVNGLVAHGLIEKRKHDRDARVTLLRLTDSGHAACARLERWGHTLEESLAGLDEEAFAAFERSLGAVVYSLQAAGALVVAEPCRGCVHFQEDVRPGDPEPHRCALIDRFLDEEDAQKDCPDHTPAGAVAGRN